ncbi:MAG: SPOR domain-containing protein, partial [Deltaproteobacteria bacterium]|nr:SPOR domain-containing protein [Deltaproteobacteria bacterium]
VKTLYQCSGGYPRMINILADNALLLGYSREEKKLSPAIIKECYKAQQLDSSVLKTYNHTEEKEEHKKETAPYWKWTVFAFFALFVSGIVLGRYGKYISEKIRPPVQVKNQAGELAVSDKQAPYQDMTHLEIQPEAPDFSSSGQDRAELDMAENAPQAAPDTNIASPLSAASRVKSANKLVSRGNNQTILNPEVNFKNENSISSIGKKAEWKEIVTVGENETLTLLALNVYGQANEEILRSIQEHNPEIKDVNFIDVGQRIRFPWLSSAELEQVFTVHIASYQPFERARAMYENLIQKGYEAYIISVFDTRKGKFFRVTMGNFKSGQEAGEYASWILDNNISGYANAVPLEMK